MNPLIGGLFSTFKQSEELESVKDDDAFELFSASLALPNELLEQVEKTDLLLDSGTIGIDIVVLEVNGQMIRDEEDVNEVAGAASKIDVALYFLQCKQSHHIASTEILGFGESISSFLNNDDLSKYPTLDAIAKALRLIFDGFATKLRQPPTVDAYFVTTAPRQSVLDATVQDRAKSVERDLSDLGFLSDISLEVWGADEIHAAWGRKNNANTVEIVLEKQVNLPQMPGIDQAILGVVSVAELFKMIQTEDESLDERVFYDNVRGFKGVDNPVNRRMLDTMRSAERTLLPVLNNGVTVVAEAYTPKPGDALALSGYQVVNGCQTSHCLHLAKGELGDWVERTFVPLRIVVTSDDDVATRIIRATNSQTEVQENDLVALTKFQKQLEDFYRVDSADVKLTYERRSGQYYNKDVVKTRVLTINDQIKSVSAVALRLPHNAARYASRLYEEVGNSIFKEDHELLPYVASAFAAYRLENAFRTGLNPSYKAARYHILMAYAILAIGERFAPLEQRKAARQARTLIESLKKPDQTGLFSVAAQSVIDAAGGTLPSRDRLKRQQFTQELVTHLLGATQRPQPDVRPPNGTPGGAAPGRAGALRGADG